MTLQTESIETLKQKVSQLETENNALKSAMNKSGQLSNEAVDGILFIVFMFAVITALVLWLSNMPA